MSNLKPSPNFSLFAHPLRLLMILCGTVLLTSTMPGSGHLVEDGQVRGRIFLPQTIGRPVLLAVEELQTYFRKMTGQELPVSYRAPGADGQKDVGIYLVVREEAQWKGKESSQDFVIEETREPTPEAPLAGVTITGNTEMAVLYGVYQYLEDLGVRWYSPGEIGENVPERKTIPISPRRDTFSPSFVERGLDFSGTPADLYDVSDPVRYRREIQKDYALWRLRNRLMFQRSISRGLDFDFNFVPQGAGHGILPAVLAGVDFAKEPERFPMFRKDGEMRRWEKGGQICFTNEKNVRQAVASAVAFFEKQDATRGERNTDFDEIIDSFPMGLSDATGICECEACLRVAGDGPQAKDRLVWTFYNRVARELNQRRPGAKIGIFAPYFELTRPPEGFRIEPNIVAVSCRPLAWSAAAEDAPFYPFTKRHRENADATRAAGAEMRNYNYSTWLGSPQMLSLLDAAEAYHAEGYRTFHAEIMNRNEQMWPILWTLARYTWNSDRKTEELLRQYCEEYYGPAGEVVLDLMKKLDANSRTLPRIVYGGFSDTHQIMTRELAGEGRVRLTQAIQQAAGKAKIRLERFLDTWEMFDHAAKVYRSYCVALNERTPEAVARLTETLADCEKFWVTRNVQETCSPRVLARLKELGNVVLKPEPVGRPELADETLWSQELFAGENVPETIPDLFPLPEMWKFRIDHTDVGAAEGWAAADYDDSLWRSISTWNNFERQGNKGVDGHFWYRVKFRAPDFPEGKKVVLRFGSLDEEGDIFINGKAVSTRRHVLPDDWKTSFAIDVTDWIRPGEENVVAVRGYDSTGAGGIWRPVALYTK